MAILRVERTEEFAVVPTQPLRDDALSWAARGVMAFLLTSDCAPMEIEALTAYGTADRREVFAILRELGERGYIEKVIDPSGNINYTVHGIPVGPVPADRVTSLRVEDLAAIIKAYPHHRRPHGAPQAVSVAQAWNECVAAFELFPDTQAILDDLAKRKASHDWTKEAGRYVPSLKNYIEARMWTYPIHPDPPKDRRDMNEGGVGKLVL